MHISLNISFLDLTSFQMYIESLLRDFNLKIGAAKLHTDKAKKVAELSEIYVLRDKLFIKRLKWPMHKQHNVIRKINISYMQGYILWVNYSINIHPVEINDKITIISKQLIHK